MRNSKGHQLKDKFRALSRVHCIHTIYRLEAWEVRSPTLQVVCKSELKWRSYSHLKATAPSWCENFASPILWCENFASPFSDAKISHQQKPNTKIFTPAIPNAKISHQPNPHAKFLQLHIWLAKSSCNLKIFAHPLSYIFFLKIFCVITYFLLVIR